MEIRGTIFSPRKCVPATVLRISALATSVSSMGLSERKALIAKLHTHNNCISDGPP